MNQAKQQSDWEKDFREVLLRKVKNESTFTKMGRDWEWGDEHKADGTIKKLKSFISQLLQQARAEGRAETLKEVLPEEGIKWMQEGNHKDKRGYTEGFNACRQAILEKITNLKKGKKY